MAGEINSDQEFKIGHVLFIDIVGYSKLPIEEQREAVEELSQVVRQTEQFCAAGEAGQLVTLPAGDGMALVFSTTAEAPVHCALEIARKLKTHPELPVRMGIHSGPVSGVTDVNERSNLAGAGINMAQRVMDRGDAGHILLSKHVADDLEQYRHWRPHLHDLGECEVKHGRKLGIVNFYTGEIGNAEVPEKLRQTMETKAMSALDAKRASRVRMLIGGLLIVSAVVAGGFYLFSHLPRSSAAIPEKSIAVLPFENRSSEDANAYFADGIQDEILTRLSKIGTLKVISRTSTQHYKSTPENLPEIARELGVAHILEGSVQKDGETVRVNVQLIRAANDSHLWAETFDRKLTDIFSVESEIATAIADELRAELTGPERQIIASKPTDNPRAHDAYLRGLAYTAKTVPTTANALEAQKYFREAVKLDPRFALGWALLASVNARGFLTQSLQPTTSLAEETRQAAETAVTLQPNLGEAILAKGWYYYACLKDYDSAVYYFEQAHQLLPNSSSVPESLAFVERRRNHWDRSESFFNEAERLDPRNVLLLSGHATNYVALRRFPEALRKLDQILEIAPNDLDTLVAKAAIAQAQGDLARARILLSPLRPAPEDPGALEVQVYQAILERRPAEIIPRLVEILEKPNPSLGFYNGELRFWLGWTQELAGDHTAAYQNWLQARSELDTAYKEQPGNFLLIGDLALVNMALGDKNSALTLCERAMTANPIQKDALTGPIPLEVLARVAARLGDRDRAVVTLKKLLSVPYAGALLAATPCTSALLRLDPMFDLLRDDQRFQQLLISSESN
jgi:TolB-like protein/Tfp pilus assembly protein PilF